MTHRDLASSRKLAFTWLGNYNNQETLITLIFQPEGAGTRMTLRQDGFATVELRDGYSGGWAGKNGSFDKLDTFLAKARR